MDDILPQVEFLVIASGVSVTVDDVNDDSSSTQPIFPTEVMRLILGFLKEDTNTLLSVVRANHYMYDIVIPNLYDTVTINERNWLQVTYGNTVAKQDGTLKGKESITDHSRKDKATALTRKMVLDVPPDWKFTRHCRALEEVIITTRYFKLYRNLRGPRGNKTTRQLLKRLSEDTISRNLNVTVHIDREFVEPVFAHDALSFLGPRRGTSRSSSSHSYECSGVPPTIQTVLDRAICSRSVVHLPRRDMLDEERVTLIGAIRRVFVSWVTSRVWKYQIGMEDICRLRLSGVSHLLLSSEQRASSAENINTVTKEVLRDAIRNCEGPYNIAIFNNPSARHYYDSVIELVEADFIPPADEIEALRTRTLSDMDTMAAASSDSDSDWSGRASTTSDGSTVAEEQDVPQK